MPETIFLNEFRIQTLRILLSFKLYVFHSNFKFRFVENTVRFTFVTHFSVNNNNIQQLSEDHS